MQQSQANKQAFALVQGVPDGRSAEPAEFKNFPAGFERENFSRAEASAYLRQRYGIRAAVRTMAKWAWQGGGPPFYRDGKYPVYPVKGLDDWANARLGKPQRSTSDVQEVA